MLDEIGDVSRVEEFMQGVKEKRYRLMGFGHRVYKNMDPRAKIMIMQLKRKMASWHWKT